MAIETLYASQQEAAALMGVDFGEVQEMQRPRLAMEDTIVVDGQEMAVYRAHSGPDDGSLIAKGGIRMYDGFADQAAAVGTVQELAVEMYSKVALRGHGSTFMGGKGLIVMSNQAPLDTRVDAMRQFEAAMEHAGIANWLRDVPAGDVGVGSALTDVYADAYHINNPDDPRWQAVITGKSPDHGGAEFRPAATGWGTYVTQLAIMESRGERYAPTTIQGFGNVGGYHAHFASHDPDARTPVQAISDVHGIIHTGDPRGLPISMDMVDNIANNPDFANDPRFTQFAGNKILALAAAIDEQFPSSPFEVRSSSNDIISHPAHYFVPAALGNAVTAKNMHQLGATKGLIEAGNGTTTPAAHRYLTAKGLVIAPDIIANGAGADGSIKEWEANLRGEELPTEALKADLAQTSRDVVMQMLRAAEYLGTRDMRVAAAGLGIARLMERVRPEYSRELLAVAV